jgi:hypothetical protein
MGTGPLNLILKYRDVCMKIRASALLLFISVAMATANGPVYAGPADATWASCESCGLAEASAIAENKAPPLIGFGHSLSSVYVVSIGTRTLYKFQVQTDREPGLYSRDVWQDSVETSVRNGQAALWEAIPVEKIIDIPAGTSGSAADYIRNPVDRSNVYHYLRGGASGFFATVRSLTFMGTVYSSQALATLGADRGPVTLNLRFPDGSSIVVTTTVGVDGQTAALSIVSVDIVPDSARSSDGFPLPTQASGFEGYDATDLSGPTVDLLRALVERFGLHLIQRCGSSTTRFRCDKDGRCELVYHC